MQFRVQRTQRRLLTPCRQQHIAQRSIALQQLLPGGNQLQPLLLPLGGDQRHPLQVQPPRLQRLANGWFQHCSLFELASRLQPALQCRPGLGQGVSTLLLVEDVRRQQARVGVGTADDRSDAGSQAER